VKLSGDVPSIQQIKALIKDKSKSDKPFFIYWATGGRRAEVDRKRR
jgi:hypothetical protein